MKAQTYGKAGFLLIFMLAALAGFVYLFKQSTISNSDKQENVLGSIYRMKQVDANWTADVLKAYVGLSKDYDAIGVSSKELPATLSLLSANLRGFSGEDTHPANADLDKMIKEKALLVEKFKRRNAVLKNSLRYLPTVQMEITAILMAERAADPRNAKLAEQKDAVDQLVSLVLQYNLFPEDRLAASVQLQNESMRLSFGAMSPNLLERVRNLVRHVDVILSERIGLAMLVAKINEVPIAEKLDSLTAEIGKSNNQQSSTNVDQRNLALIYGGVMLLLFGLIGFLTTRRIVKLKEMTRNARARLAQLERRLAEKTHPEHIAAA